VRGLGLRWCCGQREQAGKQAGETRLRQQRVERPSLLAWKSRSQRGRTACSLELACASSTRAQAFVWACLLETLLPCDNIPDTR
jgi:hypothetical protein